MVDLLYSGTRTADAIIAGMFGGAIYRIVPDGIPSLESLGWVIILAASAIILNTLAHAWYEYKRGEPFR